MTTDNWINLVAAILVAGGTLALAFMTWKSIRQTRSIHERECRRRRVDDVQNWFNEVMKLSAVSLIPVDEFDTVEMKRRASELFKILANSRWVQIEAKRLDLEVKEDIKLLDKVHRLLFIFEHTAPKDLGDLAMREEIKKKCTEALEDISAIKAALLV